MNKLYYYNKEYTHFEIKYLDSPAENLPLKGIHIRILSLLKFIFLSARNLSLKSMILRGTVFYSNNNNEYLIFESILKSDKNKNEITNWGFNNKTNSSNFPDFLINLLSIFFIPYIYICFLLEKNIKLKKTYEYCFDTYCKIYPTYFIVFIILFFRNKKIKNIVFSNDMHYRCRIIKDVAKFYNLETIYIPHTQDAKSFPLFEKYDMCFLPGKHYYELNLEKGLKDTKIFLLGNPKFDGLANNDNDKRGALGICPNTADDFTKYEELIKTLKIEFSNYDFILRPHHTDRKFKKWESLAKSLNISFSDSRKQNVTSFIKEISIMIAGESNIHFEATYLDVKSFYYINNVFLENRDSYKIIENNLTSSFSNFDQLFKLINDYLNEPENNVSNVEYYYENFNSIYKFTSTELVYNLLFMNDTKPFYKELDKQNNIIYRLNKKNV